MSKEIIGTNENFNELINGDKPVLVDFWASWCGPCRMLMPTVEQIADEFDGKLLVCKVNVDEQPDLARQYQISTIPCLILFADGDIVEKSVGAKPKHLIVKMLEQVM
ncbi:MAG: thioredoxin [Eubacteriales bacterium]|nr:thioredoxin [Eubacteriales bacterium]